MENEISKVQSKNISKLKEGIKEGVKIGLFTFIISYLIVFLLSIIINFTAMNSVKSAILGAINSNGSLSFGGIVKLAVIILSFSVFNNLNNIRVGMLFFSLIPFAVLFVVGSKAKVKRGISYFNIFIFFVTGVVFSVILTLLQGLTQGKFLDIYINFLSIKNFIITVFVIVLLQIILGLNYNKKAKSYIIATRLLFRMSLGLGGILAVIDLIKLAINLPVGLLSKIGATVLLLPNFIVYNNFLVMGNNIKISDSIEKLISKAGILGISSGGFSFIMSIIAIVVWIAIVIISIIGLKKGKYFLELLYFALLFSIISCFLAFSTSINLGKIILVGEMNISISIIQAFLIPLISILALGLMVWLIRKMIAIIKEI